MTITQSVTIDAPTGIVGFIHPPSGTAIAINASSTDTVIIRGLELNGGTGNGISANTVGQLFVEHCTITGFAANGVKFQAPGGSLFMDDDDVRGCGNDGVNVQSLGTAARAVIRDSYFAENGFAGVEATTGSIVTAIHCVSASNVSFGFTANTADSPGTGNADMTLDGVQAVSNFDGVVASTLGGGGGTATLRFANSLVTQNTRYGVSDAGGSGTLLGSSPGTTVIAGNGGTDVHATLGTALTLY